MRRSTRIMTGIGATGAAAALAVAGVAAPAGATERAGERGTKSVGFPLVPGRSAVGLAGDGTKLVSFPLFLPQLTRTVGAVRGLTGDTKLVGIDYRVQDRKLYGVGNAGGVYTLSTTDARATKVSQVTVPLSGTNFGVDFNPAADRLRIISDTGQNLRHDVNNSGPTVADGTLTNTLATTPPTTATATGVTAAAYTNNDLDASTATTLFDLDTALDQVSLQSPANSGQLAATGKLGVDAGSDAGFDIHSGLSRGRTVTNTGWATLSVGGSHALYSVSLLTGQVQKKGSFARGVHVTDLAVVLDR